MNAIKILKGLFHKLMFRKQPTIPYEIKSREEK